MFGLRVGALLALLVLWAAMGLDAAGVIGSTTAALFTWCALGYIGGLFHASHQAHREEKAKAVAMLAQAVDHMGTLLTEEELDDDQRQFVQAQRAGAMELLGLMDRPPLRQRLRARLKR